ncbi:CPBP family intramembrane glutamic endopeptidase [Flavihumibacter profundi]|uniref:CPBP family intramembrane glutamic endopeptidase n=1 Tax=Flavihumibacter profundi TaxID=2716883 RepID=UPI001CC6240E|nr:type II CAAX endopeptidase family protein [Flavihumibacter profundi]MBZ5857232.1 CPBP family intramembrane metalloprotease [Flavihumibacter profundi]
MAKANLAKPLIPFGWLRTILFLLVYLAAIVATGFLKLDFYTMYTLICIISVTLVLVFSLYIDRINWRDIGIQWSGFQLQAATGFSTAIAILGSGTCILVAIDQLNWMDYQFNGSSLVLSFGLMLMVAFAEEGVFRGYVLRNLLQSTTPVPALMVSAALFAIFHGANPNASWLALVNVFIAGILLGINYIFTKNLWFGIALHFAWNFFQGPVLGYEVSGLDLPSILTQSIGTNTLLTGGAFGFEGSLINTILCTLATGILGIIYWKQYRPRNNQPVTTKTATSF